MYSGTECPKRFLTLNQVYTLFAWTIKVKRTSLVHPLTVWVPGAFVAHLFQSCVIGLNARRAPYVYGALSAPDFLPIQIVPSHHCYCISLPDLMLAPALCECECVDGIENWFLYVCVWLCWRARLYFSISSVLNVVLIARVSPDVFEEKKVNMDRLNVLTNRIQWFTWW